MQVLAMEREDWSSMPSGFTCPDGHNDQYEYHLRWEP